MYLYKALFPALMMLKSKYYLTLKNVEDVLHPAVPDIQLTFNDLYKNN